MPDPSKILRPGSDPPIIHPMCAQCERPVDRFGIDPISSVYYLTIEAECHGRNESQRIPVDEVFRIARGHERLVMFKPRAGIVRFRY